MYAYIPLRGPTLFSGEQIAGQPREIYTGLVTPYYSPNWEGFWNLVLAKSFAGELSWDWGSTAALGNYWQLLTGEFSAALVLVPLGILWLAYHRPRLAATLIVGYGVAVVLVARYRTPIHFPAYTLPANLLLCLIIGAGMASVADSLRHWLSSRVTNSLLVALIACLALATVSRNLAVVDQSQADSVQKSWQEFLDYPLEPGAGLMAHWGDLTPLWYYQHAEGYRRDLVGLFPPDEKLAREWLSSGHDLYLTGPLLGWGQGLARQYHLVSWGYFVKVLLPNTSTSLPGEKPRSVNFGGQMLLIGQYADRTVGATKAVRLGLHWRVLSSLSTDHAISLRLVDGRGHWLTQRDERLVSQLYPAGDVATGEDLCWVGHLPLPAQISPGEYRLQAVVYRPATGQELSLSGEGVSGTVLDIGLVRVE